MIFTSGNVMLLIRLESGFDKGDAKKTHISFPCCKFLVPGGKSKRAADRGKVTFVDVRITRIIYLL